MKENERCKHPDCIYRATKEIQGAHGYNCNYLLMTGRCRTVGLPERLKLPCNCPRYIPDGTSPTEIITRDWRDEARSLYDAGATDHEIAEALGISYDRANRWRRSEGLPIHPDKKGSPMQFDWQRAEDLYRHGASDCEIARQLGCSVSSVWRWRYKYELFPVGKCGSRKSGETTPKQRPFDGGQ